jgi:FkbM family methyltransferase
VTDPLPIAADLASTGFRDIWSPVTALQKLAQRGVTLSQYWLSNETGIETPDARLIGEVEGRWADEKSRQCYRSLLAYRSSGNLRDLPPTDGIERQYLAADVPLNLGRGITFVDGGAYIGDTLQLLLRHRIETQTVYAFEPDPVNYRKLASYAESLAPMSVISFPCGIGLISGQVRFNASGLASASASADGDTTVQIVSLDQALAGTRIDYLKLDVEGSELDALRGAERLIRASKPRLAISAYHRPDHLWELPKWLLKLNLGYALYLRAHGHQGFDSVVYAV